MKTMEFRRFKPGKQGREYIPGKIRGSQCLEIEMPCGAKYYLWPSERDSSLVIQAEDGNLEIRPHSQIIAVRGFTE